MSNQNRPLMVVLSSPSGAGKTTLSKKIQQSDNSFKISVSHTTRRPRANEIDGVDYYFVSEKKFKSLLDENAFYEHSKIFENYYGTSKSSVNEILKELSDCWIFFDNVVFPAPEGEDKTTIRGLLWLLIEKRGI